MRASGLVAMQEAVGSSPIIRLFRGQSPLQICGFQEVKDAYRGSFSQVLSETRRRPTFCFHLEEHLGPRLKWTRPVDPLLTMRSGRQLVATGGTGFGLIPPFARPGHLPPVATDCAR